MFCKKCGSQLSDDAKFCKKCGTPIYLKETQLDDCKNIDDNFQNDKSELTKYKKNTKKKKLLLIKLLSVLLVFIIIYYALAYFFNIGIWISSNNVEEKDTITVNTDIMPGTTYELNNESVQYDENTGINYVDDIIIVFLRDDATDENISELLEYISGEIVGKIPVINQYQIRVSERTYEELIQLCADVSKYEYVEDACIDQALQLEHNVIPQDPWEKELLFLGDKWDEENPEGSNWWQEAINAPSAWEYYDYMNSVNIGVVDDGFDLGHEDLAGVIRSYTENNSSGCHGTHVAGIIGAASNNKTGITGVVWDANIYTTDWDLTEEQEQEFEDWNTESEIYKGVINLITLHNAKVINLSLGLKPAKVNQTAELVNRHGENASRYILNLLEGGYDFVIVQSAGNGDADDISIDSKYNGLFCSITEENCKTSAVYSSEDIIGRVIVVGAARNDMNGNYTQAEFSNAGDGVDICAPGVDIYSTVPGGYQVKSGTSMAAPIVTGVASLVWSIDEKLTGAEVKSIVCSETNTKYVVKDNLSDNHPLTYSYRLVNAELAVKSAFENRLERKNGISENPLASIDEIDKDPIKYIGVVLGPEDVVIKMFDALQNGDYEAAAECLDPATEQKIDFWGEMAASIVGLFIGENISWGQLVLEIAGATDVEIIECNAYNKEYNVQYDAVESTFDILPWLENLMCIEADVYVKYRYKYDDNCFIEEDTCHVRRYEWSGWRIEDN